MNAISYEVFSETSSGWSTEKSPTFETDAAPALTIDCELPHSWITRRWRDTVSARSEQAWAFLPEEIAEALESGADITSSDIDFLVNTAFGSDPVQAVAALRVLGHLAALDEVWRQHLAPILSEALRHPFGRIRAEAAEALWASNAVECIDDLEAAIDRERHDHVKRTMVHAVRLLRGQSGAAQR